MTRGDRLQQRFDIIEQTLRELHGKEEAFCAALAAHLRAVQYGAEQSMKQVRIYVTDGVAKVAATEEIERLDKEHQAMLQGVHERTCKFLGVDPARALELSKAFEQVVRDICLQGG